MKKRPPSTRVPGAVSVIAQARVRSLRRARLLVGQYSTLSRGMLQACYGVVGAGGSSGRAKFEIDKCNVTHYNQRHDSILRRQKNAAPLGFWRCSGCVERLGQGDGEKTDHDRCCASYRIPTSATGKPTPSAQRRPQGAALNRCKRPVAHLLSFSRWRRT